jgi:hypothetical protein
VHEFPALKIARTEKELRQHRLARRPAIVDRAGKRVVGVVGLEDARIVNAIRQWLGRKEVVLAAFSVDRDHRGARDFFPVEQQRIARDRHHVAE